MGLSFKELKEKNAADEEKEKAELEAAEKAEDNLDDDDGEPDPDNKPEDQDGSGDDGVDGDDLDDGKKKDDTGDGDPGDSEDEDLADFLSMVEEEEEEGSDGVPVKTHVKMKQKFKGKISDRDKEIEQLKAENADLKSGAGSPKSDMSKRPKLEDFDNDDEKHEEALEKWRAELSDQRAADREAGKQNKQAYDSAMQLREEAINGHFERVDKMVSSSGGKIKADVYEQAEKRVRSAVEEIMPERGDAAIDYLIQSLGEGSERVVYFLGKKPEALAKFKSLLVEDPMGMSAATFLGEQKNKLTKPKRRTSAAPNPAKDAKGDSSTNSSDRAARKAYEQAHARGDASTAFKIIRKAKKGGTDVSGW